MDNSIPSVDGRFENAWQTVYSQKTRVEQIYRKWLDHVTPFMMQRWIGTFVIAFIYMVRVMILQGFYIVTYALAIYILNLLIGFLSPKWDPTLEGNDEINEDGETEGPVLPVNSDDEFRPFVRRLPEFKFWYSTTKSFMVALFCTFFTSLDIPVFWPILLVYFIILFLLTMKRQIRHMIKYRYVPFSLGKKSYLGKK